MWKYKEAQFYGNKTTPKPGDSVVVILKDDSVEEPEIKEFVYGFDSGQSKAAFMAMVKSEVKAHLAQLNKGAVGDDVTDMFEPED